MDSFSWSTWAGNVGDYLPRIIGALLILIIGWIVALICRSVTRSALGRIRLNERLPTTTSTGLDVQKIIASVVFWIILLFALIGMFNLLNIDSVSNPLSALASTVMLYLPRLLLAGALALVAWVIATVARRLISRSLASSGLEKKLAETNADNATPVSQTLGDVFFWLIILLFLPAIVAALQMQGLLSPLTNMVHELLGFLPNLIAAIFIGGIGYLIAKVLRNLVTSVLSVTRADKLTEGENGGGIKLSSLCGTLVFILVLAPALIAALNALQIDVIAQPARHMLELFLDAVPNILAAAVIVFIAWFIGRFVADMLGQLLTQIGFDRLPAHLGFKPGPIDTAAEGQATRKATPSEVVGRVALFFVMAFAIVEAANRLGFGGVNDLFEQLIGFAAQVLFGLVILAVGQWLANLAARAIQQTAGAHAVGLSRVARIAILGLVVAMGLHAMGFADSIVNLAFGLVLGAVAVAVALAFGLGGRDAAGRITRHWVDGYLARKDDPSRRD